MLAMTALLLSTSAASFELHAKPLQPEILVGEPVKLQIVWSGPKRFEVCPERLRVVVTGSGGYRFVIGGDQRIEDVRLPTPVEPGMPLVTEVLLLHGDLVGADSHAHALLFPGPGDYGVQVIYDEAGITSAPARIHVVAPEREEAEVYQALYGTGKPYDEKRAAGLLAKHPDSRYLRMARLGEIVTRLGKVAGGEQPDTGESLPPADRRAWQVREAQRAIQELESGEWGGWDEDRLSLAIDAARGAGDSATAARLEEDVLRRLPESAKAQEIKRRRARSASSDDEDDKEPPAKPSPTPKQ